jgi:hypothetical protein
MLPPRLVLKESNGSDLPHICAKSGSANSSNKEAYSSEKEVANSKVLQMHNETDGKLRLGVVLEALSTPSQAQSKFRSILSKCVT